jgi:hypothetical protein
MLKSAKVTKGFLKKALPVASCRIYIKNNVCTALKGLSRPI